MKDQGSRSVTREEASGDDGDNECGHSPPPPAYTSLPEAIAAGMQSLMVGDPNEEISVPMIHSIEQKRKRDLFLPGGRNGIVTRTVLVRKMAREHYLKHYAKDAQGNYIGTAQPAPDAGLVFVPGKSTDQDILEQVRKVAFGKEHSNQYFVSGWATTGAGGGAM
ncbi:uncharacterized protein ALTATR162_LOCUS4298 [Alternaria atra]|uniref:Uncharacterized protein n=1 Tax=Alternaria atra TaxID=119953 RepID=A0A8J2I578_9PLEO|nr:uncharacterized protein ALTATR162_LOCUS4298 [Alternaria atra]CAG5156500.1 unnamed protein product [Alternaria atra]